ncbi:phage holin family protein [Sphingobium sp. KCTC 72723]|uniref:phage holin family protein n=1 Tax=Sphingobium sp. KCTC 72723 TaxID=2733867 RepID=UPI0021CE652F|nr:phage holin family protein [Sphingobium sp. KCTC 72723]
MTEQPADAAVMPPTEGQGVSRPDEAHGPDDRAPDETVREVMARLYTDGRAYASAEAEKQKLRIGIVGGAVRNAAIFVTVALMLVFASIVAFLIGLIIALAPRLGPLWATFAVLGASMVVALLLLLLAKSSITRMKKAIAP